jgi:hypothetical protein
MKSALFIRYLIPSIVFLASTFHSLAQTKNIAIVSLADTTIVNQHIGVTIFGNFTDTLHLDLSVTNYLEQQLQKYLSTTYTVNIVHLPDSVTKGKQELKGSWGMHKEIKQWLSDSQNQYDIVIFTFGGLIPRETLIIVPDKTSGFYSRGRNKGLYTTIYFAAYRTKNQAELEYYMGCKLISPLKDFKLPDDNRSLTPGMLEMIQTGLIKLFETRIIDFLTKTYLVPQKTIDSMYSGETMK